LGDDFRFGDFPAIGLLAMKIDRTRYKLAASGHSSKSKAAAEIIPGSVLHPARRVIKAPIGRLRMIGALSATVRAAAGEINQRAASRISIDGARHRFELAPAGS